MSKETAPQDPSESPSGNFNQDLAESLKLQHAEDYVVQEPKPFDAKEYIERARAVVQGGRVREHTYPHGYGHFEKTREEFRFFNQKEEEQFQQFRHVMEFFNSMGFSDQDVPNELPNYEHQMWVLAIVTNRAAQRGFLDKGLDNLRPENRQSVFEELLNDYRAIYGELSKDGAPSDKEMLAFPIVRYGAEVFKELTDKHPKIPEKYIQAVILYGKSAGNTEKTLLSIEGAARQYQDQYPALSSEKAYDFASQAVVGQGPVRVRRKIQEYLQVDKS